MELEEAEAQEDREVLAAAAQLLLSQDLRGLPAERVALVGAAVAEELVDREPLPRSLGQRGQ